MQIKVTDLNEPHFVNKDEKPFLTWILQKDKVHAGAHAPQFREGEIWWCAVGENVGVEINGKNERFSRPVLIYKKLSKLGFLGIPLTSKPHEGAWYVHFNFLNKTSYAILAQARTMSVYRLYKRMGQLPGSDFMIVVDGFQKLYFHKNLPPSRR